MQRLQYVVSAGLMKPQLWQILPPEEVPSGTSPAPHLEQNLAPGSTGALHRGHSPVLSLDPHCVQNRASVLLIVPQMGHFIEHPPGTGPRSSLHRFTQPSVIGRSCAFIAIQGKANKQEDNQR
jgi:hypothetical protein